MRNKRTFTTLTLCCGLLLASLGANAQSTVNQSPDKMFVYGEVLLPDQNNEGPEQILGFDGDNYVNLGINGTLFRACKLTAFDGLYCLDSKTVRNWPEPMPQDGEPVVSIGLFDCTDEKLGLDDNKGMPCTGMTVDLDGNIWLAGKNKGKSHSLIKFVPDFEVCPQEVAMGVVGSSAQLCAYEVATGRPLVVDLVSIDGPTAEKFSLPGHPAPLRAILGLEERKTAVAFLEDGTVIEVASGKNDWGLIGNEQLLTITLLQLKDPLQNFILAATTSGRILAWDTAGDRPANEAFNPGDGNQASFIDGPCAAGEANFSARASSATNLVYFTDSEYCDVSALTATRDAEGKLHLDPVAGENWPTTDLIAVTGVTVGPGNTVDLSNCSESTTACPLVVDEDGNTAASVSGVQLVDASVSGLTLFEVEGIPDCRYTPLACLAILGLPVTPETTPETAVGTLIAEGLIVPLVLDANNDTRDVVANPGAQRLNITPLLPEEVTDLFPAGLPAMLLPRYVRGQQANGFVFGGIFGVTQDGVVFRETFEGHYDVEALAGSSLGCAANLGSLDWDIVGTVSEHRLSATTDYDKNPELLHLMSIINSGCGSSRTRDPNFSFKPFNLEPTRCTFNPDLNGSWSDDGICAVGGGAAELADDAVYAKLTLVLADDFKTILTEFACTDRDGNDAAPLETSACINLSDLTNNLIDKLKKCWDATQQPKQSSGDQNCQALDSQLSNLQQMLGLTLPNGSDLANRVGELNARAMTLRHVLDTRFLPSLASQPDEHFVEPQSQDGAP